MAHIAPEDSHLRTILSGRHKGKRVCCCDCPDCLDDTAGITCTCPDCDTEACGVHAETTTPGGTE